MATREQWLTDRRTRTTSKGATQQSTVDSPSKSRTSIKTVPEVIQTQEQNHPEKTSTIEKNSTAYSPEVTTTTTESGGVSSSSVSNEDKGFDWQITIPFQRGMGQNRTCDE